MTAFVYGLQSVPHGWYYVGSTDHLLRRFHQHSTRQVKATKRFLPVVVLGWREYEDPTTAKKVEWALKKSKSRLRIERWLSV